MSNTPRAATDPRTATVISVPYIVGREATGMGAGPLALEQPAVGSVCAGDFRRLALSAPVASEVSACFDLNRQVAAVVREATASNRLAVVLTGNCHTQQGVVAGLGTEALGLVWFDCHADFHTPDTTASGFFDGQALSMVVGDCWTSLCASVPGFDPLSQERVVLAGARDFDGGEQERLAASAISRVDTEEIERLSSHLDGLRREVRRISLHVDLDVLDPAVGRANAWAVGPGLNVQQLVVAVEAVRDRFEIAALTLSAYDPIFDLDGRVRDAAIAVIRAVAGRRRPSARDSK